MEPGWGRSRLVLRGRTTPHARISGDWRKPLASSRSETLAWRNVLDRLFPRLGREAFVARHFGLRTPAVEHGSPGRLPLALPAPEVERLLERYGSRGISLYGPEGHHTLRVRIDAADYGGRGLLLDAGLALGLVEILDAWPELRRLGTALVEQLGLPPSALALGNCFIAPGEETGVTPHFHSDDSFLLHLHGDKELYLRPGPEDPVAQWDEQDWERWNARGEVGVPPPTAEHHAQFPEGFPRRPPLEAMELHAMRPGTVAYIPRGTWHHTRTPGNQTSISVALFVRSPRTVDAVLEVLRLELAQLAPWRRPLRNPHLAPDDRVALQARLDELPARVAGLLASDVVRRTFGADPRSSPRRYQRIPGTRAEIARGEADELELRFVGAQHHGTAELPVELHAVLADLVGRTVAFASEEIEREHGLAAGGADELLAQLVGWGLLAPLPFRGPAR